MKKLSVVIISILAIIILSIGIEREVKFSDILEVSTEQNLPNKFIGKQFTENLSNGNTITWELAPIPGDTFALFIKSKSYNFRTNLTNINSMPKKEFEAIKRKIFQKLKTEQVFIKIIDGTNTFIKLEQKVRTSRST